MPRERLTKRRKWLLALGAVLVILLLMVPLPMTIRTRDREHALRNAVTALLDGRRVWIDREFTPLYDSAIVGSRRASVYFRNETDARDEVFMALLLKPMPKDRKPNVNSGDVIIAFHLEGMREHVPSSLQFGYVFGLLGAHAYEIRIYRSILRRYIIFHHTGVS